jgi:anti-sigma factor RsiW
MEHSFIEAHNQIDRYVRGTMPVAERTAFEEHFLDCPNCLQQLEVASSLRGAIRIVIAEMAPSAEPVGGASGRFRPRSPARRASRQVKCRTKRNTPSCPMV